MGELADERKAVAAALEALGFNVRWFEGFGGTDDRPDVAYMTEVAGADIYVGIVADVYGNNQPSSGFSATHEEYLEARKTGSASRSGSRPTVPSATATLGRSSTRSTSSTPLESSRTPTTSSAGCSSASSRWLQRISARG
jgi:hypothetical protein